MDGACGPSRCPTSLPSSATSSCGRPSTSSPGWSRGHGYATEAARAALEYGFTDVGLAEIVSFTVPQNERSWRVMERIGLVRDPSGDFDHPRVDAIAYPHIVRHVLYRLDRPTWEQRQVSRS